MIVLHIGMPKAGSTTIQTFLEENADALRSLSIDYPSVGRKHSKDHSALIKELRKQVGGSDVQAGSIPALVAHLKTSNYGATIISAEMFSRQGEQRVVNLKEKLSAASQPFRIIMVIRDLMDQIVSMYGQKVRFGNNTYDFDKFFDQRVDEIFFNPFATAKLWAEIFGWEALRVRPLDRNYLLNGDLIDDFLSCSGLDPERPEIRSLPRQERLNESSGWKCLEAGRALFSGRYGLSEDHVLAKVMSTVRKDSENEHQLRDMRYIEMHSADVARESGWTDKGHYLTRAQAQRCLDVYGAAIRDLNTFLGVKLPEPLDLDQRGFVEREFMPDAAHIPPDELAHHYNELGSRLAAEGLVGKLTKTGFRDYTKKHQRGGGAPSGEPRSP
jgi:hypothetical protein